MSPKRTDFANLVLVSEEDMDRSEWYRIQSEKERLGAVNTGYDTDSASNLYYYGVVKEPVDLKFVGTENTIYTNNYFTLQTGSAFTRFKVDTDLSITPTYDGGDHIRVGSSQNVTIAHVTTSDTDNYAFLCYVELRKSKKYDESGQNAYFVDRQDNWILVQMTQAQVTSLSSYTLNPNGYVDVTNIAAPHLDSLLSNDEKTYTFGGWSIPSGIFTINSFRVNHYNSLFLGKVEVTSTSPIQYKFYHTLPGSDALYGVLSRPGFSVVDQYHRNRFGNGTQTDGNPHGMHLTDIDGYNDTEVDHRNLHHNNGIMSPNKFTTSLECLINGTTTPDSVSVTQLVSGDYLFLQGKRVTSVATTSVSFSDNPASGVYYIYVQATGSPTIQSSYPYEYYTGILAKGTSVPSDGFVLCSIYYDQPSQTLKAYSGDPRYSAGSTTNPVTDLRVYGVVGYSKIHSVLFEGDRKENVIPFGSFEVLDSDNQLKGWSTGTPGANLIPASGNRCLKVGTGLTDASLLFPFDANIDWSFRVKLHTDGASCTYQINLLLYRGKNRTRDKVGSATTPLASGTVTYSSWTLAESEFLSSTSITWDGVFTDRDAIGWAVAEISVSSGNLYIDDIILRPKIRTIDISNSQVTTAKINDDAVTKDKLNADTAGYALAQHTDGSLKVVADESTLSVDTGNDWVKVKDSGITNTQVNATSNIGLVYNDGTVYQDTGQDTVGYAIRIVFANGTTKYVPATNTPGGTCFSNCFASCFGSCDCDCGGVCRW